MNARKTRGRAGRIAAVVTAVTALSAATAQVIVDNVDGGFSVLSGAWNTGSFATPWGADYRWIETSVGPAEVEWRPTLPTAGNYDVDVWYVQGSNRSDNAPFTIHHAGGATTVNVDQQSNGSAWFRLGTFPFAAGTAGSVTLSNQADPIVVIADAVRFTPAGAPAADEFRGMWLSRFEWPNSNLIVVQNNIRGVLNNLQAHNFNALLMQVRGQADTLYPSPEEPWSPLLSSNGLTPGGWGSFDPLAFGIAEAHARGIEFHAYINTHVAWQGGGCPVEPPTYNLDHVYWDHFNAADPAARDWLVHDDSGNPVGCEESNYTWIAPGVPDAQAYVRRQIMYVVENYDVDGVHFDRIRTPGTEFSHDPISEARRFGEGNPDGLGFADWTRDQITRFNRDIYAQIMEVDPSIKVSSAPLGLYASDSYPGYPPGPCGYFYGFSCVYQDAQAWLAAGAQDFIVPQIYWADGGGNPDFSEILPDWLANAAGRHIYAGQLRSVGVSALLSQVGVTRSMGGGGNVVFSYGSFNSNNYWPSYSGAGGPYELPAATPEMPWKSAPTQGIIIGNVYDFDGVTPLVDCHVTRSGSGYTALSSGDGLYSFLLVDPGLYQLTFDMAGVGSWTVCNVEVAAGQVTRIDTTPDDTGLPADLDADGAVDLDDLLLVLADFGNPGPGATGDVDGDGDTDLDDLLLILANFGVTCS